MTQPSFHKDQPPHGGQQPWGPAGGPPPAKPWYLREWALITGGILLLLFIGGLANGGRDPEPAPAPPPAAAAPLPAAAAPAAIEPTEPAEPVVTEVTLPEVEGRNGAIVYDELIELGLTNLQLASADEEDTVVLLPANWTAVSIEPGAGTTVDTDDTVVVTMTKQR